MAEGENELGLYGNRDFDQNQVYHLFLWDAGKLFKLSET